MDGFSKGEYQPEKHSGRQRERAAGQHGDNVEALLEGEDFELFCILSIFVF